MLHFLSVFWLFVQSSQEAGTVRDASFSYMISTAPYNTAAIQTLGKFTMKIVLDLIIPEI